MSTEYGIFINDALGNRLAEPRDWQVLDYTRVENDSGPLTLTLPGSYDAGLFQKDGSIEVWRSVDGGAPYLDTETLWLIRRRTWQYSARSVPYWTLYAWDLNSLIKLPKVDRRIVDYAPGTASAPGSVKVAAADDMGKAIMRENFGSLATDTTRSIATWLTIQANLGLAPVIYKEFARASVLKTLQDIAATSYQGGTYLVFDIVASVPPGSGSSMQFEFRSYTGQRGVDHRFPSGNPPLLIGPDFNNLDNVSYDYDATGEITRGIAIGPGLAFTQAVARASDTARLGESPFGLTEGPINATTAPDASTLTSAAQAELRSGIPRKTLTGTIVDTSGLQYGVDWKWGDLLTGQVKGDTFDCHASRVHVHAERDAGDKIDGQLMGTVA